MLKEFIKMIKEMGKLERALFLMALLLGLVIAPTSLVFSIYFVCVDNFEGAILHLALSFIAILVARPLIGTLNHFYK